MNPLINGVGETGAEPAHGRYDRISVAVETLLFSVTEEDEGNYRKLPEKKLKVLMVRRSEQPFLGLWSLPGGFMQAQESLESAVERNLKEKTNIDHAYMEQLYTYGEPDRDPRARAVSVAYLALVDGASGLNAKDADNARWFSVDRRIVREVRTHDGKDYVLEQFVEIVLTCHAMELAGTLKVTQTVSGKQAKIRREIIESRGIAFDHAVIIGYGLERLQNKIEYTDIAFQLMPEYFTLTELQQVYEIILSRELLKANFRRKIAPMVLETNLRKTDAGHRPSKLYKFNPHWMEKIFV